MYLALSLKGPLTLFSLAGLWVRAATVGSHGFNITLTGPSFTLIVEETFLVFVNKRIWDHILGTCSIALGYSGPVRIPVAWWLVGLSLQAVHIQFL